MPNDKIDKKLDKLEKIYSLMSTINKRLINIETRLSAADKKSSSSASSSSRSSSIQVSSSAAVPKKRTKTSQNKTGQITIHRYGNVCSLTGNTYDKKGIIKGCSGWFNGEKKMWLVRDKNFNKIYDTLKRCTEKVTVKMYDEDLEGVDNKKSFGSQNDVPKTPQLDDFCFLDD